MNLDVYKRQKLDPLNPFKNMWDQDVEARKRVEFSMPAIRENYEKFMEFYDKRFRCV